ncbi:hypothetical protein C8R44DRAFT_225417 [Mycena epipterygia]|nr:hypothetical protein C8R44DRAFT_225417 [Mycena epipterygia]
MELSELPPELMLETCTRISRVKPSSGVHTTASLISTPLDNHFPITDLLTVSHISQFWRSTVLEDKRWTQWFGMIVNPETEESAHDFMSRFKLLDTIPARMIVTLCLSARCALCEKDTTFLFMPLIKRICNDCLKPESGDHIVMCLTAALTMHDLSEKDVKDLVVLHWEETDPERKKRKDLINRAKLVSAAMVKNVAIDKYGGEDKLATHLEHKKARLWKAYEKRLAEYNAAITERRRLKNIGDAPGSAAVTLKNDKKVPKTRPRMPAILKAPFTPAFYQTISILPTNFLVVENGGVCAQRLVTCTLCNTVKDLRWQDSYQRGDRLVPQPMLSGLLPSHEQALHFAFRHQQCHSCCHVRDFFGALPARCETCLNRKAIEIKEELDATV